MRNMKEVKVMWTTEDRVGAEEGKNGRADIQGRLWSH
jgi:hypothetical protein